jgi:hypothetical protein
MKDKTQENISAVISMIISAVIVIRYGIGIRTGSGEFVLIPVIFIAILATPIYYIIHRSINIIERITKKWKH